tara:strand:+ start:704 stop:1237 length:534 start_codon:yes stop_codon:yes gene_type:complete
MYLLKLNKKGDIFKDDDGVTGVPEFINLIKKEKFGPTALKWVALVYDYESPYRHYSESERIKAVSKDLYDTYSWKQVKDVTLRAACDKYNELQFDPLDEQLIAFNKKINQFTELIDNMHLDEENAEMLQKLMIGVEKILKTRQSLLDAIDRRGERQKIAGDKGLSFLERRKEIKEMN